VADIRTPIEQSFLEPEPPATWTKLNTAGPLTLWLQLLHSAGLERATEPQFESIISSSGEVRYSNVGGGGAVEVSVLSVLQFLPRCSNGVTVCARTSPRLPPARDPVPAHPPYRYDGTMDCVPFPIPSRAQHINFTAKMGAGIGSPTFATLSTFAVTQILHYTTTLSM